MVSIISREMAHRWTTYMRTGVWIFESHVWLGCDKHTSPILPHLPGGGGVEGQSLKAASLMYTK